MLEVAQAKELSVQKTSELSTLATQVVGSASLLGQIKLSYCLTASKLVETVAERSVLKLTLNLK